MIGYKGFNSNLEYEEGKTYQYNKLEKGKGFYFYDVPINVLNFYNSETDKYAIIEALGNIKYDDHYSFVTDKIKILNGNLRRDNNKPTVMYANAMLL